VQCVNASEIGVSRDYIPVDFLFNEPKGTVYTKSEDFTITNHGNDTLVKIQSDNPSIINPIPSSFSLDAEESQVVTLLIEVSSKAEEGTYYVEIKSNGEIKKRVKVTIAITYCAKVKVSPSSIDFGKVHRSDKPSKTVTISEELGYKDVNVQISKRDGNNWVIA